MSAIKQRGTANGDAVFLAGDLNLTANHAGLDPVYSSKVGHAKVRVRRD